MRPPIRGEATPRFGSWATSEGGVGASSSPTTRWTSFEELPLFLAAVIEDGGASICKAAIILRKPRPPASFVGPWAPGSEKERERERQKEGKREREGNRERDKKRERVRERERE